MLARSKWRAAFSRGGARRSIAYRQLSGRQWRARMACVAHNAVANRCVAKWHRAAQNSGSGVAVTAQKPLSWQKKQLSWRRRSDGGSVAAKISIAGAA